MNTTILTLRKLNTTEDEHDQKVLKEALRADEHSADIIVGGPLLGDEVGRARLEEACTALTGKDTCPCESCEASNVVTWSRQRAAYFVGLAVGLRLARTTADGGVR